MDGHREGQMSRQLPTALQLHILSFLPPNERALSGRLVSAELRDALSEPQHSTATLSQPLPPHAAPWAAEATHQHFRQLPFHHKLQLLCTAATSGSEVNLELVLRLLQPILFSEVWYGDEYEKQRYLHSDPGVAAVQAGHPQLLGVMLDRFPGLLAPHASLAAAAEHCDLAGLQAAWEVLRAYPRSKVLLSRWREAALTTGALDYAARSRTPDAMAKMEWLMLKGCRPGCYTAAAAVRSGDVARLLWLRDRGCSVGGGEQVLESALQHAGLAVAQWLVDEAGCGLPPAGRNQEWHSLLKKAVNAPDAVAKLRWLHERGAPPLHEAGNERLADLVRAAAAAGRVDVLQHLRSLPGLTPQQDQRLLQAAFARPRAALSIPVLEYLKGAGMELTPKAYSNAASVDVVRWLAREGSGRPATEHLRSLIMEWPHDMPAHSRDLLQAVQLLIGQVGCTDWGVQQKQTEQLVCAAARRGDLALVQYLLQQLPGQHKLGGKVLIAAAEGGCEALLEWLVEQHPGCLAGPWSEPAYVPPARKGDQGTLAVLRRLGVPWAVKDVLVQAVKRDCEAPVLEWLLWQRAPVGRAGAMEAAVAESGCLTSRQRAWLMDLADD